MQYFGYQDGRLCAEQVPLTAIADRFGTPCYVYSRRAIETQWRAYADAFAERRHLICYAVKANSNIAVLNVLARLGSGFDIVSIGELERVLKAGGAAAKVVFSGVGKQRHEMARALETGIKCFNIESLAELIRLNAVAAEMACVAPVSIRINPDVNAETHPYIATGLKENKFGLPYESALDIYAEARSMDHINITGIDCHIGSQITSIAPFADAIKMIVSLTGELRARGTNLQHINVGGGLGICYENETPPSPAELAATVCGIIKDDDIEILLEPGRSIVGNAGVLMTRVEYLKTNKEKNFAIVDAAMNDLLRPALYTAWQNVLPVNANTNGESKRYDLVGPICESGDFIATDRELALQQGDLLAVCSAGAYGFCMSSNYNSRPRAVEVMADKDKYYEIRRRETINELFNNEILLPE